MAMRWRRADIYSIACGEEGGGDEGVDSDDGFHVHVHVPIHLLYMEMYGACTSTWLFEVSELLPSS
jgi:hypothetical protein